MYIYNHNVEMLVCLPQTYTVRQFSAGIWTLIKGSIKELNAETYKKLNDNIIIWI